MRLQALAIDDIHRLLEEAGDIILEADIVEDGYVRLGVEFHQNIDVAVGPSLAARNRAEQSRMPYASRTQGRRMVAKLRKDFLPIHGFGYSTLGRPVGGEIGVQC